MPERHKGHQWHPIADVSAELRTRRFAELDALLAVFEKRRAEIESAGALREFQARMVRSWSIETGILERLYTLTASATLTLLEQGFDAALLTHGDSDRSPADLIAMLRDHQDAAEGLFKFVRGERALSTSYVKELHQAFTRHQPTCDAMDANGNWVQVPLRRGDWKVLPNNPGDVKTGEVWHQYCPPEQAASEMDRLVAMHAEHGDVHFAVEAAWLHHRFTQIHPFQDGNGRVARALASLVCIRAHGFPVVVLRDQKEPYIGALERADRGDLIPLVELIERQQREAFMHAVGLSQQVLDQATTVDSIVADAKKRIEDALLYRESALAERTTELSNRAFAKLQVVADAIRQSLGQHVRVAVYKSEPGSEYWFKAQIAECAKSLGYFANLLGPKSWVHLRLQHDDIASLVVSFHHTGRIEDGVKVASAFLATRAAPRSTKDDNEVGNAFSSQVACDEAISFTSGRDQVELSRSFEAWLERAIAVGLDLWRRGL